MSSLLEDGRQVAKGWRWTHRPLAPRSAEALRPERGPREFPTAWARTRLARAARAAILGSVFRPLVWNQTEPAVEGLDRLDDLAAPVVFVANHASHLDTALILCSLPLHWRRRTAVAAAADYFFDVWWRAAGTALVFNTFPIERAGGRRATNTARLLIEQGWNLVVFPEGTRSPDGWVGRFRSGAARLCIEHGVPAVPVALGGTFAAMPRGRSWPRPGRPRVSVRFGPALAPEDGEGFRSFNGRLERALARVADEEATSWWASLRREASGETPSLTGPDSPRWRRVWESTRPRPSRRRPRAWPR